eukprot:COSAG02_NODE_12837_length_1485_cov_1.712121_3_plen_32_part_01
MVTLEKQGARAGSGPVKRTQDRGRKHDLRLFA